MSEVEYYRVKNKFGVCLWGHCDQYGADKFTGNENIKLMNG